MYNTNRRKFLGLFGCGCCSLFLPSCSTVPITERKQLSIIPESRINQQAAAAYENFRNKSKLVTNGSKLEEIRKREKDKKLLRPRPGPGSMGLGPWAQAWAREVL